MHVFILTAHRAAGQSKVCPGAFSSFWFHLTVFHCISPKVGSTDDNKTDVGSTDVLRHLPKVLVDMASSAISLCFSS